MSKLKKHMQNKKRPSGVWRGGKKPTYTYEGQQYAGGRVKGRKNLTKTDSGYINQHGVEFSVDERKALERVVNRVNNKRVKMLEAEGNLPRMVGGKETGDKVRSLQLMGKESDFIIARKSKSLQQFKSREDYDRYMKNLDIISSPTYLDDRTRLYKRSHIKALENAFGDEAKDVVMKIRMMKPEEYRRYIQSDEDLEIGYLYGPDAQSGRLNQIRASLGMKLKEEYME